MSNKLIHVAVGAIFNPQGEILIAKRPAHKFQGNLWEFPGGKVESGETGEQALRAMESCKRRRVVRDSARFFNQPPGMLKNLYVRVESLENAVRSYPEVTELRVTRTVAAN